MTTYDLGDTVPLSVEVTTAGPNGVPVDCSTMVLTITLPDGTSTTPSTTNSPTGTFYYDFVPTLEGFHRAVFVGTVPAVSYREDFWVGASRYYVSLSDLKSYLSITESDEVDDLELSVALEAAHGAVHQATGRTFGRDSAATARLFDLAYDECLIVDDIASLTDLAVATSNGAGAYTTLASTAYTTRPLNALTKGRPITQIIGTSDWSTGELNAGVQVTAKWGWPAVPPEISQATLLLSARLFKRRTSPEGVAGFGDMGVVRITSQDADVARLLAPYTLPGIA